MGPAVLSRPKVAVTVVFVLALFMSIMDTAIVNVALPGIGRDLGVAPTDVDAVSVGYLVSVAVIIPAGGWFGNRFGGTRIILTAVVIFTAASVLCGCAQTLGQLVGFRVLQGVGGGMVAPVGMAMLYRVFPPAERIRASATDWSVRRLGFVAADLGSVIDALDLALAHDRYFDYINNVDADLGRWQQPQFEQNWVTIDGPVLAAATTTRDSSVELSYAHVAELRLVLVDLANDSA